MAIKLVSNYAKRLGLPGFSSHQFSVSVETELSDLDRAPAEIARLYHELQSSVDREIQRTGFVPDEEYGLPDHGGSNGNHSRNGRVNGNGHGSRNGLPANGNTIDAWNCSAKQQALVADLQKQLGLSDAELYAEAHRLFGKTARSLDKLAASGLITALLERAGKPATRGNGNGNGTKPQARGAMNSAAPAARLVASPSHPSTDSRTLGPTDYLSSSRLKCWQTCRSQFFFRYVQRIPVPTAPALFLGQQVHEILRLHNWRRWRGESCELENLRSALDESWEQGLAESAVRWKKSGDEAIAKSQAWAMLENYLTDSPVPHDERPEGVEVEVECFLDRCGVRLVGIVDLVRPGGVLKVSPAMPRRVSLRIDFQGVVASMSDGPGGIDFSFASVFLRSLLLASNQTAFEPHPQVSFL